MDALRESLQEVVATCPFNSFGKMLLADNQSYPPELGGNCVFQNRVLVGKIREKGFEGRVQHISARERPHWITICTDTATGVRYALDPFCMHDEPIPLRDAPAEVKAHPHIHKTSALFQYEPLSPDSFCLELRPLNATCTAHKRLHNLRYTYDWRELTDDLPSNGYQLLAGLRQKMLEFAHLSPRGEVIRVYMEPVSGRLSYFSAPALRLSQEKAPQRFMHCIDLLAQDLKMEADAFLTYFSLGRDAYLRRHPELVEQAETSIRQPPERQS